VPSESFPCPPPPQKRNSSRRTDATLSWLFIFSNFQQSQGKSILSSNAMERLHKKFKRRIRPRCPAPRLRRCSPGHQWRGQITMRWSMAGKASLKSLPINQRTLPHDPISSARGRSPNANSFLSARHSQPFDRRAAGDNHRKRDARRDLGRSHPLRNWEQLSISNAK
jgi:hypothetical protein